MNQQVDELSSQLGADSSTETKQSAHEIFISDLHLCVSRPEITTSFIQFLNTTVTKARALYVLGDLFEYWAGDDDMSNPSHSSIIAAFKQLADSGVCTYLMHGNRDFLIGEDFCKAAKITLLQNPSLLNLYGKKVLLSHGDDLCTDDTAYQAFRNQVRNPIWIADFLKQPLGNRKQQIEVMRERSEREKSIKSTEIMDVNARAVSALIKQYNYPELLIHGHTHRPAKHHIDSDGHKTTRWVLGDWYEQGSYLICNAQGCESRSL